MELAEACRLAAKELRENPRRWCRRQLFRANQHGAYAACAVGHVVLQLGVRGDAREESRVRRRLDQEHLRGWNCALTSFNDSKTLTGNLLGAAGPEDVAERLDRLADRLEFGEG